MELGINSLYDGVFNSLKTFLAIRCTHLNTQSKSDSCCPGNVWGLSLNSPVTQRSLTSPVQSEGVGPQTSLKRGIYTPQRSTLISQLGSKVGFCGLWLVENLVSRERTSLNPYCQSDVMTRRFQRGNDTQSSGPSGSIFSKDSHWESPVRTSWFRLAIRPWVVSDTRI